MIIDALKSMSSNHSVILPITCFIARLVDAVQESNWDAESFCFDKHLIVCIKIVCTQESLFDYDPS